MKLPANVSTVTFDDGREICLSYGVPVAAFIPADVAEQLGTRALTDDELRAFVGKVRSQDYHTYSVTTSRHANQYAGKDSAIVPRDIFRRLVAPLAIGRCGAPSK